MEPLQPGDPGRIGPYRLVSRLGVGGMGQVFLARSPGGRPVVVKVILPEYASDAEYRARFAREVEAARRVGGFHTAQVVDADPTADPPWMATAYVPGPSLRQAVTERGPLRDRNLRTLAAGLVEGLAAIHARDLVHRDFKPSNIILAADGPRVIDFGVARPLDGSSMTQSGAVIGTLAYMSPEQVGGGQVGQASDVFSLGTVLAFAATGRSPYMADSIGAIVARIVGPPPELTELPDDLRELIHACWEQDPDRRPATAELLARLSTDQTGDDWPPAHLADLIGSVLAPGAVTSPNPSITAVESPEPHGPPELPRQHGPPLPDRPPDPEDGAEGSPDNLGPAVPQEGSPESPGPTVPQEDIPENPGPAVPQEGIPDSPGPTVPQEDIPGKPGPAVPKPGWSPPLVRPPRWKRLLRERRSLVGAAVTVTVLGVAASLLVWLWTSSGLYSGEAPPQTGAPSGPAEWSGLTEPRVLDVGDQVLAVAFSPDGSVLASGGADGAVRLWKAGDGEEAAVLEGHADWVRSVAFSPDGSLLASASDDGTVRLWDVAEGEERAVLEGHADWVRSVAFSPDGSVLASASDDRTVRLWDTASGEERNTLDEHTHQVLAVAFSPDGSVLASASKDDTVRLRDPANGEEQAALEGNAGHALSVAFGPDGSLLANGNEDGTVRLWDVAEGEERAVLEGHADWVRSVAFSPDGSLLASASDDGTVRLWNTPDGTEREILDGHTERVWSVAFSPEGSVLASASKDGTVRLRPLDTG